MDLSIHRSIYLLFILGSISILYSPTADSMHLPSPSSGYKERSTERLREKNKERVNFHECRGPICSIPTALFPSPPPTPPDSTDRHPGAVVLRTAGKILSTVYLHLLCLLILRRRFWRMSLNGLQGRRCLWRQLCTVSGVMVALHGGII